MSDNDDREHAAAAPRRTRRVRVRSDRHPLANYEHVEVDESVAGQWDEDRWHDAPPV